MKTNTHPVCTHYFEASRINDRQARLGLAHRARWCGLGDRHLRPLCVGLENVCKCLRCGNCILSSQRCARSTNLNQSEIQPLWLGFPHRPGRYRVGGSPLLSYCRSERCTGGFHGSGVTLDSPRVALAFNSSPTNSDQPAGGWFPTTWEVGVDGGGSTFSSSVCWTCK